MRPDLIESQTHISEVQQREVISAPIAPVSSPPAFPITTCSEKTEPGPDEPRETHPYEQPDSSHQSTASTHNPQATVKVCLCQPEPKIPRPRNAFILYRQHHQVQLSAHNPRLSNPEISKVIGERWQAESSSIKDKWRQLAEEEKARHQQQYPDYRYQPKRSTRGNSSDTSPGLILAGKHHCARCGGRTIRIPSGLFTDAPFGPSTPRPTPDTVSPTSGNGVHRFLPMMNNLTLNSPHSAGPNPRVRPPPGMALVHVPATRDRYQAQAYSLSPLSPEAKRRRFETGSYEQPQSARLLNGGPQAIQGANRSSGRRQPLPLRRESLPPYNQMMAQRMSPMTTLIQQSPNSARGPSENILMVAPPEAEDQSRNVEAMMTTMSIAAKVRMIGRVSPPLNAPAVRIRGAIIAIEGEDIEGVKSLASTLDSFLSSTGDFSIRHEESPLSSLKESSNVALRDYLSLICDWHQRSRIMVDYITTSPAVLEDGEIPADEKESQQNKTRKPVIIIGGYQVRSSDAFCSRIPITDEYSPADHWSWVATMWRGIVGPDFTIYLKDANPHELANEKVVEVREELRMLVLRKAPDVKQLDQSAMRRVGFETSEWIRQIGKEVDGH